MPHSSRLASGLSTLALPLLTPARAFAASLADQELCSKLSGDLAEAAGCSTTKDATSLAGTIVNLLLFAVGLASVIMIIYAGVQISSSAGNSSAVEKGKKTLIYAIAGLVLALSAYTLLNFVLNLF